MEPSGVPPITLAAGLGVVGAVNSLTVTASLKWPNDVLVGKKKLAGILTEMSSRANTVDHVVVGIGVNLNTISFPDELAAIATSLRIESGDQVDRARFTESLLGHLEAWLDRFFAGGVGAIADDWTAHADLASHRVRAGVGRDTVSGVATGLDADGALCVRDDAGKIHRVVAGDVILLAKGAIGS